MPKPKGARKTFAQRLTPEEKREVIRLSEVRPRVSQRQIAAKFSCCVDTIRHIQKKAGVKLFPEITARLEAQIVRELREGNGQHPTAKKFRVSTTKVAALMMKHGIVHRSGNQGLPPRKRAAILRAVLRREDSGRQIAKKLDVSRTPVMFAAHGVYGDARFAYKPPLTSSDNSDSNLESNCQKFVETVVKKKLEASEQNFAEKIGSIYAALVERYITLWHGGKVPEGTARVEFIARLLEETAPDSDRLLSNVFSVSDWLTFREETAGHLAVACDCVARDQATRWTN